MKKLFHSKTFLFSLFITICFLIVPAQAGWLEKLGGSIFQMVMDFFGFSADLNGYCWFCPLFDAMFKAAGTMMTKIMSSSKDHLLILIACGTLLFIVFKVGATVIKLQEVDLMQFLGELFKVLGRVIIASAIIACSGFITKYILTPFLGFAFDFALNLIENNKVDNKLWKSADGMLDYSGSAQGEMSKALTAWKNMPETDSALNDALRQSMIAFLAKISANLVVGMAVGVVLIVISMFGSFIFADLPNALSGVAIFGAFTMIYISIPFQMINMLVQLAFVMALMPFWVALWIFQKTAQYTKKAFDMLLHVCLTIITTAILLVLVFALIGHMLPNSDDILTSMIPGYDLIAGKKANVFQSSILLTLAMGFLCKELVKAAPELATRITQSYGVSVGESVGNSVAQQAGAAITGGMAMLGLSKAFGTMSIEKMRETQSDSVKKIKGMVGWDPDRTIFTDTGSQNAAPQTKYTPQNHEHNSGNQSDNKK